MSMLDKIMLSLLAAFMVPFPIWCALLIAQMGTFALKFFDLVGWYVCFAPVEALVLGFLLVWAWFIVS